MKSRKVAKEIGVSEYTIRYRAKILGIKTLNYDNDDILRISNFKNRLVVPDPDYIQGLFIQTEKYYIVDSKINCDVCT